MKTKHLTLALIIAFTSLFLTGCFGVNEKFTQVRNQIMNSVDGSYKTDMQFALGSVSLTFSRWVAGLDENDKFASELLEEISGVQVGIYKKTDRAVNSPDLKTMQELDRTMKSNGWKCIVRNYENNSSSAIYVNSNKDLILNKIFVVNFDNEELVLVEVEGNLKQLIAKAIAERNLAINY